MMDNNKCSSSGTLTACLFLFKNNFRAEKQCRLPEPFIMFNHTTIMMWDHSYYENDCPDAKHGTVAVCLPVAQRIQRVVYLFISRFKFITATHTYIMSHILMYQMLAWKWTTALCIQHYKYVLMPKTMCNREDENTHTHIHTQALQRR